MIHTWAWGGFVLLILFLLALDLFVFNRNAHEIKFKEALWLSAFWIGLALVFNVVVYFWLGSTQALEFLTGYLIEKSLSVDNLFVFIIVFQYFRVEPKYQHEVLFWGVVGALVMRAIFIFAGVALIQRFDWIIYVFGGFLVFTGLKMAFAGDEKVDPSTNPVLKLVKRFYPIHYGPAEGHFFVTRNGKRMATTLFLVLLIVETTDLVFALDSIPAILAISKDPFIVFTSNVFAILGMRALFFALAGLMQSFHYLKYGLALVLVFIGVKMVIGPLFHIHLPIVMALGVVAGILAVSIVASLIHKQKT